MLRLMYIVMRKRGVTERYDIYFEAASPSPDLPVGFSDRRIKDHLKSTVKIANDYVIGELHYQLLLFCRALSDKVGKCIFQKSKRESKKVCRPYIA